MIRPMSSVVRTVQQNVLKKPFSTSRVMRLDFEQKLQRLEKEQLKVQGDDTPVYLRSKMYFTLTCILGVVAGGLSLQSFSKVIIGN